MSQKKPDPLPCVPLADGLAQFHAKLAAVAGTPRPTRSRARVGSGYPRLSHAAGVHKSQIAAAKKRDAELGVPTEYSPDGRPEFRTRGHQKAWVKAHGWVNQDGGYGD